MKAKKIYLTPSRINKITNVKGYGLLRTLLLAGMLLFTIPSMAQYYQVTQVSGTGVVAGVTITITSTGTATDVSCPNAQPYREGTGVPSFYTWSFSAPVAAVRLHIDAINTGDDVSFMVDGNPYTLSPSEVSAMGGACYGTVTAVVSGGSLVANGGIMSDATIDIYNSGLGINSFTVTSLGAGGGVVNDFYIEPVLDFTPVFTNGTTQSLPVCQDAAATDISGMMDINDLDNGQTLTWSVTSGPTNGTLSGYPVVSTSNGGVVSITGVTYTPNAGYNGPDAFTITIDDGTYSSTTTVNVNVKPTPDVTVPSNQAVCNGNMTTTASFTGTVGGTIFDWVTDEPTIGAGGSGSGDIVSFSAVNGTFNPIVATFTVTPTAAGCVGTAQLYTITVNPTPDALIPGNQTYCNGDAGAANIFGSDVTGTTYTWTNSNSSIGLANSGAGNTLSYTATNSGTAPITGVISVTPTANTCVGPVQSFTVTVNPTPMLSTTLTPTEVCYNSLFTYAPASATTGTTFGWSRAAVTGISNAPQSGTGTISETLVNTTTSPIAVDYVYTLSANSCTNTQTVTVMVNPELLLTSSLNPPAICDNALFSYTPTSATSGTTFQWNRNLVSGIANPATTNSFNPLENLDNTTTLPVVVTYNYSIIYNACSNTEDVTVTVNPSPMLSTTLTPAAVCDSTPFVYGPASATPGTTFTWSRGVISGISNLAASGVDTIRDTLVNTTTHPVTETYTLTNTANGCSFVQYVTLSVNPLPMLSSSVTPPQVCNKSSFDYFPASATVGTTFTWSRAAQTGIANPAKSDTGSIHEILNNTTANPITVNYIDTLTINGCINTEKVSVLVNPTPRLSSVAKPAAICNKQTFTYTPTSATVGATYDWIRPYVLGIDLLAGAGTDNPLEQLINTTNFDIKVSYLYKVTINGCSFSPDSVTVVVHPTPGLSSDTTATTCSSALFSYLPESLTPGTSFSWKRAHVAGITPTTGAGTGNISENLGDTATFPINAVYVYTVTITGTTCTHTQNVVVKVNPAPTTPIIAINPPSSLCSNTRYQNFGAATTAPTGTSYIWTALNASVMATGADKRNALVTFNNAGTAKVILTTNIGVTACKNTDTFTVNVGSSVSDNPNVIYYNGQFICLQNDVTNYQWGYDDAITLDSTLIPGEVNQEYFNSNPDFMYKYYWLMTNHNGCMQKTYYNLPTGISNINTDASSIKVYPNPASAEINVEVSTTISGNIEVEVLNLLGQKVNTAQTIDHKATISVTSLPSGCYLVNCYREGVKIATAKFIKN